MASNAALAVWLEQRRDTVKPAIAKAIYEGLRMRVLRGDFDELELESEVSSRPGWRNRDDSSDRERSGKP